MRHPKSENMMSLLGGALMGAAAMYLLDPEQGRRRREFIKGHAEEYLGSAGEALSSGFEKASEQARDVGQTIAEKAEDYAHRLGKMAHEYSEQLTEHARDAATSLTDRATDAKSSVSDTVDDLHTRGRKLWDRYTGKAQKDAGDMADGVSDYGNQLWNQVRVLGKKLSSRADDAMEQARSYGRQPSSPVIPVAITAVGCAAAGLGLMYLMDPERGRSRRAWLGDKMRNLVRQTGGSFYRTGRDLAHRASGFTGHQESRYESGGPAASERLQQQVRDELGRIASEPHQIQVMADAGGSVTLTGSVPAAESDGVIAAIEGLPGVILVINRLDVKSGQNSPGQSVPNS